MIVAKFASERIMRLAFFATSVAAADSNAEVGGLIGGARR